MNLTNVNFKTLLQMYQSSHRNKRISAIYFSTLYEETLNMRKRKNMIMLINWEIYK